MSSSPTATIQVEHQPSADRLESLGVFSWPIWTQDVSRFPWTYDEPETCYLLAGEVVVTPQNGEPVTLRQGDLVTFPAGMDCTWDIRAAVKKHYSFG